MRRIRLQFGLRGLLIALLVLPPLIAVQYRRWHDGQIWKTLGAARRQRDEALVAWRVAYDSYATSQSKASEAEEVKAQQRYYAAREDIEKAIKALHARYGSSDKELLRAMEERRGK